jgi:hypothetical protein
VFSYGPQHRKGGREREGNRDGDRKGRERVYVSSYKGNNLIHEYLPSTKVQHVSVFQRMKL